MSVRLGRVSAFVLIVCTCLHGQSAWAAGGRALQPTARAAVQTPRAAEVVVAVESVAQSNKSVPLFLDAVANSSAGRSLEHGAVLEIGVKRVARHVDVLDAPLLTTLVSFDLAVKTIAGGYQLERLDISVWPAWHANLLLDLFPCGTRPGFGGHDDALAVVAPGRLVEHSPTRAVSTGATARTRGRLEQGRAVWSLEPANGQTIDEGQTLTLAVLLAVHERRQSATLRISATGRACHAVLGVCTPMTVELKGAARLPLLLRPKP